MGLSCSCDIGDYDFKPGEWQYIFYDKDLDFKTFKEMRAKRCCSCGELIGYGDICVSFPRYRYPHSDIEARFNGYPDLEEYMCSGPPEIPMADHFHCEACGEIYFNLTELGFECVSPSDNMQTLLQDYKTDYGPRQGS